MTKQSFTQRSRASLKSPLARNAGWMFGGQVASACVQAGYFVVLARLLGSSQYGIFAGAAALVSMFTQYSGMGSGLLFLRYVSPDHSKFPEYWGNILLSISLMGGLLIFGLHLMGRWAVGESAASVLVLLALGDCICGQLTAAAAQVFQTFEQMRITASLNFLTNLLRLALGSGIYLTMHRATAWTWATASLGVSVLVSLIAVSQVTARFGYPRFSIKLLRSRLSEGAVFAVSGSTTTVYNDIDKVMLGHYGMAAANGIYSMAYRVVNISAMPIGSIHSAAFPRFFREGLQGVRATRPLAARLLKRTALLGAAAAAGMFLCAPLIPRMAGHDFSESVRALRWLCLIPLLRCFHLSAGDALAGAGLQRFRLISQFIAAVGNFGMNLYLIPRYSWLGAAWASLMTDGSLALMNWALLHVISSRASLLARNDQILETLPAA